METLQLLDFVPPFFKKKKKKKKPLKLSVLTTTATTVFTHSLYIFIHAWKFPRHLQYFCVLQCHVCLVPTRLNCVKLLIEGLPFYSRSTAVETEAEAA